MTDLEWMRDQVTELQTQERHRRSPGRFSETFQDQGDSNGCHPGHLQRKKVPMSYYNKDCWLAHHGVSERGFITPCEGRLVRVHLLPQQLLKREGGEPGDPRSYILGCGGITGIGGHHGELDSARTLRIPYLELPAGLLEMAEELGLGWWLEREYARTHSPRDNRFDDRDRAVPPAREIRR